MLQICHLLCNHSILRLLILDDLQWWFVVTGETGKMAKLCVPNVVNSIPLYIESSEPVLSRSMNRP